MPPRELSAYVRDITDAAGRIGEYTAALDGPAAYQADTKTREAVERCFQIIGEGLMELRDRAPHAFEEITNATDIIGFRHILVHRYFDLDPERVWKSIQDDLPVLVAEVSTIQGRVWE